MDFCCGDVVEEDDRPLTMDELSELAQKQSVWIHLDKNKKQDALTVPRRDLIRRLKDTYVPKYSSQHPTACARWANRDSVYASRQGAVLHTLHSAGAL